MRTHTTGQGMAERIKRDVIVLAKVSSSIRVSISKRVCQRRGCIFISRRARERSCAYHRSVKGRGSSQRYQGLDPIPRRLEPMLNLGDRRRGAISAASGQTLSSSSQAFSTWASSVFQTSESIRLQSLASEPGHLGSIGNLLSSSRGASSSRKPPTLPSISFTSPTGFGTMVGGEGECGWTRWQEG